MNAITATDFIKSNYARLDVLKLAQFIKENCSSYIHIEEDSGVKEIPLFTLVDGNKAYTELDDEGLVDTVLELESSENLQQFLPAIKRYAINECLGKGELDYDDVGYCESSSELNFLLSNSDKVDFDKVADFMVENELDMYYDITNKGCYVRVLNGRAYTNLTGRQLFDEYEGIFADFNDKIVVHAIEYCMTL